MEKGERDTVCSPEMQSLIKKLEHEKDRLRREIEKEIGDIRRKYSDWEGGLLQSIKEQQQYFLSKMPECIESLASVVKNFYVARNQSPQGKDIGIIKDMLDCIASSWKQVPLSCYKKCLGNMQELAQAPDVNNTAEIVDLVARKIEIEIDDLRELGSPKKKGTTDGE